MHEQTVIQTLSKCFSGSFERDSHRNIRLLEVLGSMGIENAQGVPQNQSNGLCLRNFFPVLHGWERPLNRIVTGDETWAAHVNAETKQQSMEWGPTDSPT
ncbi:hypothetical protein TNCV_2939611 [Trichonephila clavipes]|nr:hypothetical protein TNCV_317651 [Trichonephila clavipes]GFX06433.1 hypothetical protein TNCV_2939611 [Trichonephila clavipes]